MILVEWGLNFVFIMLMLEVLVASILLAYLIIKSMYKLIRRGIDEYILLR